MCIRDRHKRYNNHIKYAADKMLAFTVILDVQVVTVIKGVCAAVFRADKKSCAGLQEILHNKMLCAFTMQNSQNMI